MIENIVKQAQNVFNIEPITQNSWKLSTTATYLNGKSITLYLEKSNQGFNISDNKETLKYMNDIYDLKSNDVKKCITNVIKIYGFSFLNGKLLTDNFNEKDFSEKIFDYLMCISQLTNMFAFFDKPE